MAMTKEKAQELILVAPRKEVLANEELAFNGVIGYTDKKAPVILGNLFDNLAIMRRGKAEENTAYKQPIPYAIIKRGEEVYVYERLSGGGESRLHSKLSIGVGGHMNEVYNAECLNDVLKDNLMRELEEELDIEDKDFKLKPLGIINDDDNEVGRVHLGLLYLIEVGIDTEVSVREVDQLRGFWVSSKDLVKEDTYQRLESWSQISADLLNEDIDINDVFDNGVKELVEICKNGVTDISERFMLQTVCKVKGIAEDNFEENKELLVKEMENLAELQRTFFNGVLEIVAPLIAISSKYLETLEKTK